MTVSRRIRCMKSQTGTNKSSTCKGPGAGSSCVTAGSEFRKGCGESGVTQCDEVDGEGGERFLTSGWRLENEMADERVIGERKRNDRTWRQAGTQT